MATLNTLPRTEKLQVMEALWEDLSQNAALLQSPPWHEAELQAAETALATGQAYFVSLEEAKQRLATI